MNSVLVGLSCSRREAYEFARPATQDERRVSRDGTAEAVVWIEYRRKQMILDVVHGKMQIHSLQCYSVVYLQHGGGSYRRHNYVTAPHLYIL